MSESFPGRLGISIVVAALTALTGQAAADPAPTLPIVLQVPGRSNVPLHLVIRAKAEMARIYRDAGIGITWIDPESVVHEDPAQQPDGLGPSFGLVILAREISDKLSVSPDALGGAAGTREHRGRIAYVFYDRVEHIAETYLNSSRQRAGNVDTVTVLGHAMAHEIGHLLLPYGHSETGLMRADWDADDLRDASRGELNFTEEQAETMRARLLEQMDSE